MEDRKGSQRWLSQLILSFDVCVAWLIHLLDIPRSYAQIHTCVSIVWHELHSCLCSICVTWLTFIHVFHMCDLSHIHRYDAHSFMCFICVTCLTFIHVFHLCDLCHVHYMTFRYDKPICISRTFSSICIWGKSFWWNPLVYIPMVMRLKWCPKNAGIQTVSREFGFSNGRHPKNAEIQMVGIPMRWGFKRHHRESHPFTTEHTTFNGIW